MRKEIYLYTCPYSVGILSPLEGSDVVPYGSPLGGYTSSQIEAIF